ncbi:MAG TPA: ABC transporter ATP-binding protein [Kiritimatiellia bacterium]|nr:ABC transporter ATP-binding protein [Kiritimatiellia bacterium]
MSREEAGRLLEVENLKVWFPIQRGVFARTIGNIRAVDGVTLHLNEREVLGLVGESGCGKSTLARAIMLLERPTEGKIRFRGQPVEGLRGSELKAYRREVQVVFQDPFAALNPRFPVVDVLTEGPLEHGLIRGEEREAYAAKLLADVGMNEDALYRYPHEFSGGQRQRLSIARALSVKPKVIVCDEAVSALDVSVQAQVLNLLVDLKEQYGLSYLFITHDLHVVRFIADRIAVMYLGEVVEEGSREQVMARPLHPYTRALLDAAPAPGKERRRRHPLAGETPSASRPPPGCRFHPRCPVAMARCKVEAPEARGANGQMASCHLIENFVESTPK